MTESIPSESLPPEAFLRNKKIFPEQGTDLRGRVFSTSEVASHLQSIEQTLRQIDESTATEEEKKQALHSLQPHLHVIKVFLHASLPHEQPAVGQEQPLGVDPEKTHALLSMVGQAKKALAFKQLEEALEQAQSSDDPIQTLLPAYEAVEHIAGEDPSFRPFLLEVRQLMEALRGSPGEAKRLLLPLLQRVLLKDIALGGLTPLEGSRCAAQLLFVVDHHLLSEIPGDFDSVQKNLESVVRKKVDDAAREYESRKEKMVTSGLYLPSACKASLLPQAVAGALIRPDGTLNLGIIDILTRSSFFHSKAERDHAERHIVSLLHELQSDLELCRMIETMPVPVGESGRGTVNAILLRPYNSNVSAADTRVAALSALCTWWRQGNVGNCFVVSHGIQRQEAATKWLLEDVQSLLLNEGVLTRVVDGRDIRFYGAQCPKKMAMDALISEESAKTLFEIPAIRNASLELGVTSAEQFSEEVSKEVQALLLSQPKSTLWDIFEGLRKLHDKPEEALLRASWLVESPSQNLLLCQWENAVGGVHLLPASDTSFPTHVGYSASCFHGISTVLSRAADSVGAKDFQKFLAFVATGLSHVTEKATPVPGDSLPSSLLRLRCIQVPQIPLSVSGEPEEEPLSWMIGIEKDGRFIPFKDQKEFEVFLRDLFIEWQKMRGEELADDQIPVLSAEISKALQDQPFFQHGGTQFGELCYTFQGGRSVPLLEQSTAVLSSSVSTSIAPFAKNEPLAKGGLSPEKRREAVQNFFSLVRKFGARHGEGPGMRLISIIPHHQMTLLDVPPEPLGREGDPVVVREDLAKEAVASSDLTSKESTDRIHELLNASASMLALQTAASREEILQEILKKIQDRYPPDGPKISMKAFLEGVWEILAQEYTRRALRPPPEDIQQLFFLSSLIKLIPEYKRHFIHFADTNWVATVGDRSEAVHGCFWFDPVHEQWEIINVSERGDAPSTRGVLPFSTLAKGLTIYPLTQPILEQFRQKKILELDRKTLNTLQKIERRFIDSWSKLEQEAKKLKPEELQKIYERGTLHLDRSPPRFKEAVESCMALRNEYEGVLKTRMSEAASLGDGFRYSHLWQSNEAFRLLTGAEGQFQQAVIEELTVPTPS